jgi:ADP-L-glycero-D-manno-heptose 6-epimerase
MRSIGCLARSNIAAASLHDIVRPNDLPQWLARHGDKVAAVVHMAAISSTTEKDVDKFVATNIRLTLDLWGWCAANAVRLIYASSAATYGDGSAGFSDEQSPAALAALQPLNANGWSKHLVDRRLVDDSTRGRAAPQWAGLKFSTPMVRISHKGVMQP